MMAAMLLPKDWASRMVSQLATIADDWINQWISDILKLWPSYLPSKLKMYGMLILKACLHHCKHYVIHSYLPSLLKSANNEHEPLDFNMFDPWDTSISGIAWALLGAHLSQYTKISSSQDSSWVSWIECRGCQLGKEEGVPSNLKSYMFIHGVPEGLELALCLESEPEFKRGRRRENR